jgi:hypothetical protein
MLGSIVGRATLKPTLTKTKYFFGPLEEVAGMTLDVMERNRWGDCMCFARRGGEVVGLVDVSACDIAHFQKVRDPVDTMFRLLRVAERRRRRREKKQ